MLNCKPNSITLAVHANTILLLCNGASRVLRIYRVKLSEVTCITRSEVKHSLYRQCVPLLATPINGALRTAISKPHVSLAMHSFKRLALCPILCFIPMPLGEMCFLAKSFGRVECPDTRLRLRVRSLTIIFSTWGTHELNGYG